MTFVYSQLFDASHSGRVLCLGFSALGKYVVVGTNNCLTLWDVAVGSQLVEDLCLLSDPLSIAWINGLVFVVGCSDGSLCSFKINPDTQEVQISGFFASKGPIRHLSCNATGTVLVSASSDEISIWARTQNSQASAQKIVSITCFIKLEDRLRSVLLIYERQVRVSGALLSNEGAFMTVTEDGNILIWCIETGASTSLDKSKRVPASVRFIHGENLMLIGGNGRADIVGAESMHKTQTLWHVEKQQTSTLSRSTSWRLSRQVLENVDIPKVDFLACSAKPGNQDTRVSGLAFYILAGSCLHLISWPSPPSHIDPHLLLAHPLNVLHDILSQLETSRVGAMMLCCTTAQCHQLRLCRTLPPPPSGSYSSARRRAIARPRRSSAAWALHVRKNYANGVCVSAAAYRKDLGELVDLAMSCERRVRLRPALCRGGAQLETPGEPSTAALSYGPFGSNEASLMQHYPCDRERGGCSPSRKSSNACMLRANVVSKNLFCIKFLPLSMLGHYMEEKRKLDVSAFLKRLPESHPIYDLSVSLAA
ncbi:hypothetical protein HYPSUDRAFT_54625 [Hypholoma sublateritium FD-334 SS-4]|uniref:Uncharacterized protein n=1 Tax=Hypholoma sublateritium (strain FD-334 SS-4) TaxID=945553 RepID=A0A0D2NVZ0_HYPSF|nr:hypothetical protein HYPSUDRAFT_54625 [Hypholoma sublateritium FD-334 SS-4]